MEREYYSHMTVPFFCCGISQNNPNQRSALYGFVLTDRVLDELKRQSEDGCLLCSFDAWDEEDWD